MGRLGFALLGALAVVAGIAARIVSSRHKPVDNAGPGTYLLPGTPAHAGWPTTTFDLVRIASWGLIVLGAVIVAFALVREFKSPLK